MEKTEKKYLFAFLLIYFLINIFFLTKYPFIHSDESWLSGLSRYMLEKGNFSVTEPFFDLNPRQPHAIRILFHSLQAGIIYFCGYHIFQIRLISLVFGIFTLFYFYRLGKLRYPSKSLPFTAMFMLSFDSQFIYASHFGRPEAILLFLTVYSLYYLEAKKECHRYPHDFFLGMIIGLSVGIHPNSVFLFLLLISFYIYQIIDKPGISLKNLGIFLGTVLIFGIGFILLSVSFNPNFLTDYFSYGQTHYKVLNPFLSKGVSFINFYYNLFIRETGTYYAPDIRLQMLLFPLVTLFLLIRSLVRKKERKKNIPVLMGIFVLNLAIYFVGRFNQTSVVFLFPLFYILLTDVIMIFSPKIQKITGYGLLLILLIITALNVSPYLSNTYDQYLVNLSQAVSPNNRVLASLNTEYYFESGKLYDFRNLAYIKKHDLTIEDYIRKNKIQYIIYPTGLDYIYRKRPLWNGVYGSSTGYYRDLKNYLEHHCTEEYRFPDPTYGNEIARYVNKSNWEVIIYQVKENP